MPRIALVVPAFNEARLLRRVLDAVPASVDVVVCVDDASTDGTADVVRSYRPSHYQLICERHEENRGVGAAIATGYARAFAEAVDVVVVAAGDDQMDLHELDHVVGALSEEVGYAKGTRMTHPELRKRMPVTRIIGNTLLSRFTGFAFGHKISDSQCGYTALTRRAYEKLSLTDLWPSYGYPNELLARVIGAGVGFVEVDVTPRYADEVSGIRLHHALWVVPRVIWAARRFLRPHIN